LLAANCAAGCMTSGPAAPAGGSCSCWPLRHALLLWVLQCWQLPTGRPVADRAPVGQAASCSSGNSGDTRC
jgi:hypothetical protein